MNSESMRPRARKLPKIGSSVLFLYGRKYKSGTIYEKFLELKYAV